MRVLYRSGGATGSGNLTAGLALGTALARAGLLGPGRVDFRLSCPPSAFSALAARLGFRLDEAPPPDPSEAPEESSLARSIRAFDPDVLVVGQFWTEFDALLGGLRCRKVLLLRATDPRFFHFRVALPGGGEREYRLESAAWDLVASTEPHADPPFPTERLEPLVLRNPEEVMTGAAARADLGLEPAEKAFFFGFNGKEGEGAAAWKSYSYLQDEGWRAVRSDNRAGGLFPAMDWYRAFDLVVCGAGYSAFWETRALGIDAVCVPFPRVFEDQAARVALCSDYDPRANGADDLVRLIAGL